MSRSSSPAEMTMQDLNFDYQHQINAFGNLTSEELVVAVFGEDYQHAYFSGSLSPHLIFSPPPREFREETQTTGVVTPTGSRISQRALMKQHCGTESVQGKRAITISQSTVPTPCPQNHILAERKRREKISQLFVALIAIVPGLKKTDKTSILGAFIKYLKELQERLAKLEKQSAENTTESVVFDKKFRIPSGNHSTSTNENYTKSSNDLLPEIQAIVSDKTVLIQIHCEKRKGVFVKALAEIVKLHLSVMNASIIPFGSSAQDITVLAQMGEEFNTAVEDLVKNLRLAFHQFM